MSMSNGTSTQNTAAGSPANRKSRPAAKGRKQKRQRRLLLEQLEDRRVLAVLPSPLGQLDVPTGQAQHFSINADQDVGPSGAIEQIDLDNSSDIPVAQARPFELNPLVRDHWNVNVNDILDLELFSGHSYVATVQSKSTDIHETTTLVAKLQDFDFAYGFIVLSSDSYLVSIDIPELRENFLTRYYPETQSVFLVQLDADNTGFLEGGPALILDEGTDGPLAPVLPDGNADAPLNAGPDEGIVSLAGDGLAAPLSDPVAGGPGDPSGDPLGDPPSGPVTIDVMIVYTPAAKNWAQTNEGGISNTVAAAMAKANLAASNSNLLLSYVLVHSAEVAYTEAGSSTDLDRLTAKTDGYMDNVHDLRNQYAADFVVLLSFTEDTGGLGWLLNDRYGREDWAFSLTRVQQASGSYTMIHEIGHNMGAHHHKDQNFQAGPTNWTNWSENQWSAGWRWQGNDNLYYCDLMTYTAGSYFPDGRTHTRVPYFSNPNITYQGQPIGHAVDGDNARTLREVRYYTAQYRDASTLQYCQAQGGNTNYGISRVQMGSIDQSAGTAPYYDFSFQSTEVTPGVGELLTVTVHTPFGNNQLLVWVDWNDDKDFEDGGEAVYVSEVGSAAQYTTTITAPVGTAPGAKRMRMRLHMPDYGGNSTPCGSNGNGEVQDFTLTVNADTTAPAVTVDVLSVLDRTPPLSGTVDDPMAAILVTVAGASYPATNHGDGTWTLADNTIAPPLSRGTYDVQVTATDLAGNVGSDPSTDELTILGQAYYVNDGSTAGDVYTTAIGDDANDGRTPAAPKATVQAILSIHDLEPGDVVYVDTGTYNVTSSMTIGMGHQGSAAAPVTFLGSPAGTVINRGSTATGSYAFSISDADYVAIKGFQIEQAFGGVHLYRADNCTVAENVFAGNVRAISLHEFQASTNNVFRNNVFWNNTYGVYAEQHTSVSAVVVENNTFAGNSAAGLYIPGTMNGAFTVRNNIFQVGAGYGIANYRATLALAASDYNLFHTTDTGKLGYYNGVRYGLRGWRRATGQDAHSLFGDPLFVEAAAGDFHLQSTAGSYHGGAWTADGATSPGIDTGYGTAGAEPSAHSTPWHEANLGQRNMGAYGGTAQASKTPAARRLYLYEPQGGEHYWNQGEPVSVRWTWVGSDWQTGETLQLEYSSNSGSEWSGIAAAGTVAVEAGTYSWDVSDLPADEYYRVRATSNADANASGASRGDFSLGVGFSYYVNDGSTNGDAYTTTVGDDSNDGRSPATPTATIQAILGRYDLEPGDVVYVDTGTYNVTSSMTIGMGHQGSAAAPVTFLGSPAGTVINRGSTATGSYAFSISDADYVDIKGFQIEQAFGGVHLYRADNCTVAENVFAGNVRAISLHEFQASTNNVFRNNVFWNNTYGVYAEQHASVSGVVVENNTFAGNSAAGLYIPGTMNGAFTVRNNIFQVGAGYGIANYRATLALAASDYNLFHTTDTGKLGYYNGVRYGLRGWRRATGQDAHSLFGDPLFVEAAAGDFHLQSTAGSYHGGAWTADGATSPGIDTGYGTAGAEPSAHSTPWHEANLGQRNMGAYGGTAQASKTPAARRLYLYEPQGGEHYWNQGEPVSVRWTWVGSDWQTGETLQLEYSSNSGSEWSGIAAAGTVAVEAGTYSWDVSDLPADEYYRVRATSNADANASGASRGDFSLGVGFSYYVNDGSTNGDAYTTTVGDDSNDGRSPATPTATIQAILGRYDLEPGDVVYVDTGTYNVTSSMTIGMGHQGSAAAPVTFLGSPAGTVINRGSTATGSYAFSISDADYVDIKGFQIEQAFGGVHLYRADNCTVAENVFAGNVRAISLHEFQASTNNVFRNNVFWNNTYGVYAEQHASVSGVVVENNTFAGNSAAGLYIPGTMNGAFTVRNNIFQVGAGYGIANYRATLALAASDYNLFHTTDTGKVGYYGSALETLAEWQAATGEDANSISADPLFADPAGGDFHLKSNGGRYDPASGTWVFDTVNSPAIDAGDPASAYANEPAPHGERINLGAYGNTAQASRTYTVLAAMQMTVVRVPSTTDSNGETAALPDDVAWVHEWEPFWVEIWVGTPDSNTSGVAAATVDLLYDTSYLSALEIEYGPAFGQNRTGTIDDSLGVISAIGGSTQLTDVGDDAYVLLARVRFASTDDDQVPVDQLGRNIGPYDMQLALAGGQVQLVGGAVGEADSGAAPATELWAVVYDIDDNNRIDFGDFSYFAAAFGRTVEPSGSEPPYVWWADFDQSGVVDFGDLSFFAPNFAASRAQVQSGAEALDFPPNFPDAWRPVAGGDEVQGEWFGDGGAEGEALGADGRLAASFDGRQRSQHLPQGLGFGADEDAGTFRGSEKMGTVTFATADSPWFSPLPLGASPILSQPLRLAGLPDVAAFGRPGSMFATAGRASATDAMFARLGSERQERNERWTAPGLADAARGSVAVERAGRFQRFGGREEALEDVLSLLAERVPDRLAGDALEAHDALFSLVGR
jgi:hypothetical protein